MNTAKLLIDASINSGGTYLATGIDNEGNPEWSISSHISGYFVAEPKGIENLPGYGISVNLINSFFKNRLFENGLYLGLWVDENNLWSVDVTRWYLDLNTAISVGMRNKQRAIWNISSGTDFLLPL